VLQVSLPSLSKQRISFLDQRVFGEGRKQRLCFGWRRSEGIGKS